MLSWSETSKTSKELECSVQIKSRKCDQVPQAALKIYVS